MGWPTRILVGSLLALAIAGQGCTDKVAFEVEDLYPPVHVTPSWSPHDTIAYRDEGPNDPASEGVWQVDVETGECELIVHHGMCPQWSPDGDRLAFSLNHQIYTAQSDGSGTAQLTAENANFFPAWSRDGTSIAWHEAVGPHLGVWVMSSDGGDKLFLIPDGHSPDWGPGDSTIVCDAWRDGVHGILRYTTDDSLSIFLRVDAGSERSTGPHYSPDGEMIAFTHQQEGPQLRQVWLMGSDGSNARRLTVDGGADPSWSPDGTKLVYTRENGHSISPEDGVLWVIEVASGETHQLTYRSDVATSPPN